ncbi:hypothetical protein ZWY2020_037502 [Hordeum vulgare]|nr:hypothetical protein ZWY2020_037502 [Hordeum vulgare]
MPLASPAEKIYDPPQQLLSFVLEKIKREVSSRFRYGGAATTCSSSGGHIWSPSWALERGNRRHRHHQPSSLSNSMKLFVVRE